MAKTTPDVFQGKIVKQIEYYFGDKNLPRDKFLLQKIEEDKGWVPIDCFMTFNRVKSIVEEKIAETIEKYGSGLLEIDATKKKLRRVKAMPELSQEDFALSKEKTIYCKGFPEDSTIDDIEKFFEDKGKCIFIKLRRRIDEEKTFKGSVFVEFDTKEEATAFLVLEGLKYKEADLIYMSKDAYFKNKKESRGKPSGDTTTGSAKSDSDNAVKDENQAKADGKKGEHEKGCVVHFDGAGEQTSREDIKEVFKVEGIDIAWVGFDRGDEKGTVRFAKAGDAQKAIDALNKANDDKVMLRGVETTLRVLEGDEEKTYWEKAREDKRNRFNKKKGWKNYQHGGNRKRGRGNYKDDKESKNMESPAKQVKTET